MPEDNPIDLLAIDRGVITAPAGCGKTQLIADSLARHTDAKPILILTHTNAGVVALRSRLDRANISPRSYRLYTIDGWAMRLISMFPLRSGHNPNILKLANAKADYPNIRIAATTLLTSGHLTDILQASYARIIVDEYQDCSRQQHAFITWAAQVLPTCILGDPMQAIFDFGGDALANWDTEVCAYFPPVAQLATPWRWRNAQAEPLGQWLLNVRQALLQGNDIDLRSAPNGSLSWIEMDGTDDHRRRLRAAGVKAPSADGCVLIIGDSTKPDSQRQFASQTPGAITVEAVDLRDLVSFAGTFVPNSPDAFERLVTFAQTIMTNVGASDLIKRVQSLRQGTARKPPSEVEKSALSFCAQPSYRAAVDLLVEIGKEPGVRSHRPAVVRACIKALQLCNGTEGLSFHEAAVRMREQNRLLGRPLPKRAVGSTLLLKGLEADVAVILNAESLNAKNLYVAMTRASRHIVVCSPSPILRPQP